MTLVNGIFLVGVLCLELQAEKRFGYHQSVTFGAGIG